MDFPSVQEMGLGFDSITGSTHGHYTVDNKKKKIVRRKAGGKVGGSQSTGYEDMVTGVTALSGVNPMGPSDNDASIY